MSDCYPVCVCRTLNWISAQRIFNFNAMLAFWLFSENKATGRKGAQPSRLKHTFLLPTLQKYLRAIFTHYSNLTALVWCVRYLTAPLLHVNVRLTVKLVRGQMRAIDQNCTGLCVCLYFFQCFQIMNMIPHTSETRTCRHSCGHRFCVFVLLENKQ